MHDKCFHSRSSSANPRISPLTVEFVCPQISLFINASASWTSRMEQKLDLIIPCLKIQSHCLNETHYVPQSKCLGQRTTQSSAAAFLRKNAPGNPDARPKGGPVCIGRNSTTSFLTTATLIYTIEAGITAAAGTRLALQWVLIKRVWVSFIPIARHWCLVLWFLVTTSLCQDWVICAPAAFLRCGSRFSGSLSGVKP